jgi:hypothetical protein
MAEFKKKYISEKAAQEEFPFKGSPLNENQY